MALADLTQKITDEAEERVSQILEHAQKEADRIKSEGEERKREIRKAYEAERARILADNEKRVLSSADKEVKAKKDAAKRAAVEDVFDAVLAELNDCDADTYAAFISAHAANLPKKVDTAVLPSARAKDTKALLTKLGITADNTDTTDAFRGGFILRAADFEYDLSFPALLEAKKPELEADVARILFSHADTSARE